MGNHPLLQSRAALVVAHPSHELLIHGWVQLSRPQVFVLTDGSGRSGFSRLAQTAGLLETIGAERGSIFGRLTDLDAYSAILKHDVSFFISLVEELSQAFVSQRIDYVVGDAAEGYNTVHDICRVIIGAAVELAATRHGHQMQNFDFAVVGRPGYCPAELKKNAILLNLDEKAFNNKVEAAILYSPKLKDDIEVARNGGAFAGVKRFSLPQTSGEIDVELSVATEKILRTPSFNEGLDGVTHGFPLDAFNVECLRPVGNHAGVLRPADEPPFYEVYGAKLVASGRYARAITYREHMLPLAEAIWKGLRTNGNGRVANPYN
ncbi:MAG TPA: hypothetical protein VF251_05615 [Pyrinomonadaceae bacterium]